MMDERKAVRFDDNVLVIKPLAEDLCVDEDGRDGTDIDEDMVHVIIPSAPGSPPPSSTDAHQRVDPQTRRIPAKYLVPKDAIYEHRMNGAIEYAIWYHREQTRKGDGRPYIMHPLAVLGILQRAGAATLCGIYDIAFAQAVILHDVLEDTDAPPDEIAEVFGQNVLDLIRECSDNKSLPKDVRKRMELNHVYESKSLHVKLLKAADKLDSITDGCPASWSPGYQRGYTFWTYAIAIAAAGILPKLDQLIAETYEPLFAEPQPNGSGSAPPGLLKYGIAFPPTLAEIDAELVAFYELIQREEAAKATKAH